MLVQRRSWQNQHHCRGLYIPKLLKLYRAREMNCSTVTVPRGARRSRLYRRVFSGRGEQGSGVTLEEAHETSRAVRKQSALGM